ncbi:iron chelate uptake ABC transporter family permease subunit [Microbacterium aquimaris]|uniref:Iron chelate uptake ABC transporter family permease subunit n=1 Tax=Microbacterium aquimaris TaxID=459816 RepID=A0ABU5N7J3_9MICO|nr:iron chelate uptake ABC transporter family permease subunit [Microbacterium aquimaris]MDZ8162050.1 iron chelate uptake ABC transporter family permease subunit [Microbacterium aquimaris]
MSTDLSVERPRATQHDRHHGAFSSAAHRRRYILTLSALAVAAVVLIVLMMTWGNEYELFSERWWRISDLRSSAILVIAVVTLCQSLATVAFQTATNNRIITPSIMGFESLYVLVQTSIIFFFGITGLDAVPPLVRFLGQSALMVLFAVLLYSWLLSGRFGNLHVMLLVGIILGTGMGALSTFMQQLLDPNEFDVLAARLFGNIGNADTDFLWIVIPICAAAAAGIWMIARRLDVIALGPAISTNLGLHHRRQVILILTLVSVLMAMSTSLVGPMTFLGFLVATFAYSLTDTYDHRRVFPMAWLLGFVVLGGAYFLLRHVFKMADTVSVIVELIGGLVFLVVILRKGRL